MSHSSEDRKAQPEMDEKEFRLYLHRLDESGRWSRGLSIVVTVFVSAELLTRFFPGVLVKLLPSSFDYGLLLQGTLAVVLLSNLYTLYHGRHFKLFRHRLAAQMDAANEQRMRADKFYGMSIIDALTGLYNRRYGEERLKEEIARAESKNLDLAVIAIDLDKFKETNDQFGHAAGDLVLKEFSRRLRRAIRACDVPVRLGGDEFLVVLPECSSENVETILTRLSSFEVMFNRQKLPVCFSRGRAQYQTGDTLKALVARADERLYADKQARKNPLASKIGAYASEEPEITPDAAPSKTGAYASEEPAILRDSEPADDKQAVVTAASGDQGNELHHSLE